MPPTGRHIFIGGRDRGFHWLERLREREQLPVVVYCLQEDEHEHEKYAPEIASFCERNGLQCRLRRRLSAEDEIEISSREPDLIIVMGWRTLISARVLAATRFGTVALHESLLPAYRGFAPVNWAVINGETQTGVSLFYLTSTGVDNGDIVAQVVVPIGANDTAYEVYERTARAGYEILGAHLNDLLNGTVCRTPQDERQATYTCARTPADGLIDWDCETRVIHNLVRGLAYPYPGACTYFDGKMYRIWSGQPVCPTRPYIGRIPGRLVSATPGHGVEVLTGDGIYLVKTAGADGQRPVPAETLFKSVRASLQSQPTACLTPCLAPELCHESR